MIPNLAPTWYMDFFDETIHVEPQSDHWGDRDLSVASLQSIVRIHHVSQLPARLQFGSPPPAGNYTGGSTFCSWEKWYFSTRSGSSTRARFPGPTGLASSSPAHEGPISALETLYRITVPTVPSILEAASLRTEAWHYQQWCSSGTCRHGCMCMIISRSSRDFNDVCYNMFAKRRPMRSFGKHVHPSSPDDRNWWVFKGNKRYLWMASQFKWQYHFTQRSSAYWWPLQHHQLDQVWVGGGGGVAAAPPLFSFDCSRLREECFRNVHTCGYAAAKPLYPMSLVISAFEAMQLSNQTTPNIWQSFETARLTWKRYPTGVDQGPSIYCDFRTTFNNSGHQSE